MMFNSVLGKEQTVSVLNNVSRKVSTRFLNTHLWLQGQWFWGEEGSRGSCGCVRG